MRLKEFIITSIIIVPIILACGWDYDTIAMEKKKFPNIHELIVGKFLRHSQEFYHWRIIDRNLKLYDYPDSLELYDDLGVAYDKTGQHEKAISTMQIKDSIEPGLYETYANIGTFYIHNGDFRIGADYIKKAIEINPDAHFGREVYQKHLVEYVLEKLDSNKVLSLPLATINNKNNFYHYLKKHEFIGKPNEEELAKAIKGIAGMMHFGQYRHPVLLEALADLLLETSSYGGSGHLGARAYLKASFESKDDKIAKAYWNKANNARERSYHPERIMRNMNEVQLERMRVQAPSAYRMEYLEAALKYEIQSAEIWFDSVRINEIKWIHDKVNADSAFAVTYYDPGNVNYVREKQVFRKNLVDEQKWLERQLLRPDSITYQLHSFKQLPDSIVKEIWNLYEQEFEAIQAEQKEEQSLIMNKEIAEEDNWSVWWVYTGAFGLLALLFFFKFRKSLK